MVMQSVLNDDFIVDSAHRPTNPQTGCQIYDMNLKSQFGGLEKNGLIQWVLTQILVAGQPQNNTNIL